MELEIIALAGPLSLLHLIFRSLSAALGGPGCPFSPRAQPVRRVLLLLPGLRLIKLSSGDVYTNRHACSLVDRGRGRGRGRTHSSAVGLLSATGPAVLLQLQTGEAVARSLADAGWSLEEAD